MDNKGSDRYGPIFQTPGDHSSEKRADKTNVPWSPGEKVFVAVGLLIIALAAAAVILVALFGGYSSSLW
jgi:hypothetical protein